MKENPTEETNFLHGVSWCKNNNWTINWMENGRVTIQKNGDEYNADTLGKAVKKAKVQHDEGNTEEAVYRTLDCKLGVKTTDRVFKIPEGQEITVILGNRDEQLEVDVELMHAEIFERVAMPKK